MKHFKRRMMVPAILACIISIYTGFASNATDKLTVERDSAVPEKAVQEVSPKIYSAPIQKVADLLAVKQEEARAAEEAARVAEEAARAEAEAQAAQSRAISTDVTAISGAEVDLLAALIYCEAGGEPYEGQLAVGAVVMNRVKSPSFPGSIREVIYQSGQFGPAITGKLERVMADGRTTDSCYQAAQEAMAGSNPIGDAVYFGDGQNFGTLIGGHWFHP